MIVLGADAHNRSHTIAAVAAATGELVGEQTVQVGARGFAALLAWARGLGGERVWAIEDCRPAVRRRCARAKRFGGMRRSRLEPGAPPEWPTPLARSVPLAPGAGA